MDGRARIAWNLRRIRSEKGITQENLAVDAQVDRTYVSGLERSEFNTSMDGLERLAAALSVDVSEFLTIPPPDAENPKSLKPGRKPKTSPGAI
jgi:transcriptional regulator with XRE-family HTH domain